MSTLAQLREELTAKSKSLASLFEEAGPERDLSKITSIDGDPAYKAGEIKRRHDEIVVLGEKRSELEAIEGIADQNRKRLNELTVPAAGGGIPFPGGASVKESDGKEGYRLGAVERKSIAERYIESEAFKGYNPGFRRSPGVDLEGMDAKALLDTTTGYQIESVRQGPILPRLFQQNVIADLIPSGTTNAQAIVYMQETTTTNAAAFVAEGGTKPESALAFAEVSSPVRKIATVLPVTDELMADAPAMRSYLEARLRLFLQNAEDAALLSGTGVAPQFTGMLNTAGIQTEAKGANDTFTAILNAITKVQVIGLLNPNGIIIHPNDYRDIRTTKDANGNFLFGHPSEAGPTNLWGYRTVSSMGIPENTALVGAFDAATQLFRREGVNFAVSDQHSDFFITNKLMLRVEERAALVVYRPAGLCTVTGI